METSKPVPGSLAEAFPGERPAKTDAEIYASTAKAKAKPKKRKAVKPKKKAVQKPQPKAKPKKQKAEAVVRSERLDMRLTKAEKTKILARARKTRRTVTSLVIEAIEKIK